MDLRDILTVAMASDVFSDEELIDQMMTFDAAGRETTAFALTWAIYLLAKHPELQNPLRSEIPSRVPHPLDDGPATYATSETIEKMLYFNAVCRKAFRLSPPVAVTIRFAVKDTTICRQPIPHNAHAVMLTPWAVDGGTALWDTDAAECVPERW